MNDPWIVDYLSFVMSGSFSRSFSFGVLPGDSDSGSVGFPIREDGHMYDIVGSGLNMEHTGSPAPEWKSVSVCVSVCVDPRGDSGDDGPPADPVDPAKPSPTPSLPTSLVVR